MDPATTINVAALVILGAVTVAAMLLTAKCLDRADRAERRLDKACDARDMWHGRYRDAKAAEQHALSLVDLRRPRTSTSDATVVLPRMPKADDTAIIPVQSAETEVIPALALQDAT